MQAAASISIKVEHLTRTFATKDGTINANNDLNFEVRRGEIFGLLGPNGAGKTTLISQLLGLLAPTSGKICVEGIDVVRHQDHVKQISGFLPQTGLPMRFVEVERALHFTGRLRGQPEAEARAQAKQLIDELGLAEHAQHYVNKLSGGMLRLTNFAMALMGNPRLLILDEPTNELDPHKRRIVWDMIAKLNREQGVTCILVTHNVLEAEQVIQRVAVMKGGRLVALGTPGALKQRSGGKVRLEFQFKDGESFKPGAMDRLLALGTMDEPRPGQYRLFLPTKQVAAATELVVNQIGLGKLDDFRLAPPSLEDVYLGLDELNAQPELEQPVELQASLQKEF
ncbi:MAG: ABC transporter ATP-binding protein [Chloroflexota bacterium]